ncbi:hypothetical protein OAS19_02880 [Altererythrobacter sp.]|nr:hypothetical protein [Altererythrobacter sp.]
MGSIWSFITIAGPILLIAALIYAWTRNRGASDATNRKAERGARELRENIEREPNRDVDL